MAVRTPRTPSYRRHKPSGQAVVTIASKDFYLGPYGSPASRTEYDRLVGEWLANGRRPLNVSAGKGAPVQQSDRTIAEVMVAYLDHVAEYHRAPDGKPTTEARNIRIALRPLLALYAATPAANFGPLALKAVRERMIFSTAAKRSAGKDETQNAPAAGSAPQEEGRAGERVLSRREVNKRVGHVLRMFKWAVANEMVPAAVLHALQTVDGLRQGKTEARETEGVKPAPEDAIDAVLEVVLPPVRAMIELQRLTGMRSGEIVIMRTCDIDRSGAVWLYRPTKHKTAHHGYDRPIFIGPRAQEILKPWLKADGTAYLFSPREAVAAWREKKRANRKTPVQPSQAARKPLKRPHRAPAERYRPEGYARAIARACIRAKVEHWHPHQLRHNAATSLRREFGLETARVILGHRSAAVTEIYAELDMEKAREAMGKVG